MNIINNKRKKDSIRKIESAFVQLLQGKELNQISVIEICKRTNLNRSTFYSNYLDIYDLADKVRENMEKDVSILYKDEIDRKYNSNNFLKIIKHIKENQLLYKTYFKLGYDNNHKIFHYDTKLSKQYFDDKYIDYHITFFMNGFNAVIKLWLKNDCKESPEEINYIIESEYNRNLKNQ
ncbi:MAG: TetR-like C-terminal domain-containing protein [Bacilli bacterium]|nr:TetR-like C-terminal domain-containing protein [Bacilli bacterium]